MLPQIPSKSPLFFSRVTLFFYLFFFWFFSRGKIKSNKPKTYKWKEKYKNKNLIFADLDDKKKLDQKLWFRSLGSIKNSLFTKCAFCDFPKILVNKHCSKSRQPSKCFYTGTPEKHFTQANATEHCALNMRAFQIWNFQANRDTLINSDYINHSKIF